MTTAASTVLIFIAPPLRLGHLRLSPYGACAGLGLFLSMALARRTAPYAGLDPRSAPLDSEAAWDSGLFVIFACLLSSRLLLVLQNPRAFTHYPLLVLGLPSLTLGGLALALVMLWAYLRYRKLALLPLLDAFAAPAALLAAFLELGHLLDGSESGMPSTLPWAMPAVWVHTGTAGSQRMHPVTLYGILAALLIAVFLGLLLTRRVIRRNGQLAALGLMIGGSAAFALDMVTLPTPSLVDLWLEPGQWVALAVTLAGALLWVFAPASQVPLAHASSFAAKDSAREVRSMHTEVR